MRPIIKQDIALYAPDVHLDMKAAKDICQVLISNSATIRSLALKAVYFSFENIEVFDEGATILIAKALLAMQNKVSVAVAFVNYSDDQFPKLKALFPNKSLPLFRTENMANLLLGLKPPPLNQTIIYYDKDNMVQTLISHELNSKGYEVVCINDSNEFIQKRRQFLDKAIYIYDIYFDITSNFIPVTIANGIVTYTLYKKVDKNISLFFNIQAHNSRLREGYKVFVFDASDTKEFNLSVLDFIMSLALNSISFEACIAVCGLKTTLNCVVSSACTAFAENLSFSESSLT